MEVNTPAVSGPATGDTGTPKAESGLSSAIDKAFAGLAVDDEGDVPLRTAVKAKSERAAPTQAPAEDPDAAETATEPTAEATETVSEIAAKDKAAEPPKHWPDARKQTFAALPPEGQKAMLALAKDLEGGFTRKSMELSDKVKFAEAIGGLLADDTSRQQLSQAGLDEVGYVRYLHSLQRFATTEPARYVQWAMQSLGVRPEQLGFGTQPTTTPAGPQSSGTGDAALDDILADPALRELRQEIGRQRETIEQFQARLVEQDRREQAFQHNQLRARENAVRSTWDQFRSSLDDHGQLAYPHADTLMRKMGAIMETDPEIAPLSDGPEKLAAAYEAAMWATPSLRTTRLESEKAAAAAAVARTREAEKAKRAVGPKPAAGAPTVPVKRGGLNAALEAALSQHGVE